MIASIQENITAVQQSFLQGKALAEQCNVATFHPPKAILSNPFLSAYYEGASYYFACTFIDNLATNWHHFLLQHPAHETQICVGLGWALAENSKTDIAALCSFLPEHLQQKVADGFGFYEGTFRKRKVLASTLPQLNPNYHHSYYTGVGRSCWYNCKGDAVAVQQQISSLPEQYQPYCWQGIGIAFTYVGGFTANEIEAIKALAKQHLSNVAAGAALCCASRKKAMLLTHDAITAHSSFKA